MEDYRLEQSGQEVQDILDGAAMQTDLTAENERAELAEQTLQGNIDNEALARQNADGVLQGHIDDEEARAKAAEKQNADDIDAIEEKIPNQASSSNQLADKEYVEDLVSTASATFRGTFNLVSDLNLTVDASRSDIAAALGNAIATADNNDYAFVLIPTSVDTPNEIASIERYKYNGSVWGFEYVLNNSGFTAEQWAAINSGITSTLVTKLGALPTASELATALLAKQDKLTFDSAPTPGSNNPVTSGGIHTAIDNEKTARQNVDGQIQQSIEAILALIPSAATALNQLADKAFVNSSIATATATFRGTYNLVSDLHLALDASHSDIAAALLNAVSNEDNNDYAFVQIPTSVDTPTEIRVTERYKFDGTAWQYEYDLNNSGFTAQQWEAINSGITALLVTKLGALPTAAELATSLAGKQNTLTFDNVPVSGSDNPVKSSGLYQLFTAIDAKFPSDASANNKLVAENRLAAYVTAIIEALDASFDLTSADGHVTFKMTQTNGVIASVQILTSDIASASQVSTNTADIAALQALYNALQQSAPQIIEPSDTWPVANPSTTVIYRVIDRVNTPPQFYSDYMWNGSNWVLMATYNNAIDDEPTAGSNNLVKSGGVFDCSELNILSYYKLLRHALLTSGMLSSNLLLTWKTYYKIPVKTKDIINYSKGGSGTLYPEYSYYIIEDENGNIITQKNGTGADAAFNLSYTMLCDGYVSFCTNSEFTQCSIIRKSSYDIVESLNISLLQFFTAENKILFTDNTLDNRTVVGWSSTYYKIPVKEGTRIFYSLIGDSRLSSEYAYYIITNTEGVVLTQRNGAPGTQFDFEYIMPSDGYVSLCGTAPNAEVNIYLSQIQLVCQNKTDIEIINKKIELEDFYVDFSSFQKFGVIGDSLSVAWMWDPINNVSSTRNIKYSWPQVLARKYGNTAVNFGFSGADCKTWFNDNNYGRVELIEPTNLCQAYILVIGTNDPTSNIGTITDIDFNDYNNNSDTFYGNYAKIIQLIRETAPNSIIFVCTIPYPRQDSDKNNAIREIASNEHFTNYVYLVDLEKDYNDYFKGYLNKYYYQSHMTATGYAILAEVHALAISKTIRNNAENNIIRNIGFIPY